MAQSLSPDGKTLIHEALARTVLSATSLDLTNGAHKQNSKETTNGLRNNYLAMYWSARMENRLLIRDYDGDC